MYISIYIYIFMYTFIFICIFKRKEKRYRSSLQSRNWLTLPRQLYDNVQSRITPVYQRKHIIQSYLYTISFSLSNKYTTITYNIHDLPNPSRAESQSSVAFISRVLLCLCEARETILRAQNLYKINISRVLGPLEARKHELRHICLKLPGSEKDFTLSDSFFPCVQRELRLSFRPREATHVQLA